MTVSVEVSVATADGAAMIQQSYSGTATQLWSFQSLGDQLGSYEISPSGKLASTIWPAAGNTLDGAPVAAITYNTSDIMKWQITPL